MSFRTPRGLGIHKSKKLCQIVSASPGRPTDHSRKRKFVDDVVLQDDGGDASVSSGDEIGPTSMHEETDARAESAADDYELPAGESNSIYYDYDVDLCVSTEPSDTVDENVVSSSLAGTVQQFPMWSKLNLSATELAMYGRVPPLDLVASGHLRSTDHMREILASGDAQEAKRY